MNAVLANLKMIELLRNDSKPKRVDVVDDNNIYIGYCEAGTIDSAPGWRLEKVVIAGPIITIKNPAGDNSYEYIWDDRATYTYE